MNTTTLKIRNGPTFLYEKVTNLVGLYLINLPNVEVTPKQVYSDLNFHYSKEMYTLNQVRKALEWQAENNPDLIKKRMGGYHAKCRIYWYEPNSTVSE